MTMIKENLIKDNYLQVINRDLETEYLTIYFIKLSVPEEAGIRSGDSAFIVSPNGENLLIDCGSPSTHKQIIPLLKDLGIKKIDNLLVSHAHLDHLGSFSEIVKEFEIGKVIRSKIEFNFNKYYNAFEKACIKNNLDVVYVGAGDSLNFGNEIIVNILNPIYPVRYPENYLENNIEFLNSESIVVQLMYGSSKVLFGGDLYIEGENQLLDKYGKSLKADVLKVNHHGEKTSNGQRWANELKPQVVVCMDDGLCDDVVYNNYIESGADYYSTYNKGTVKVQVDKNHNVSVLTQYD